MGLSDIAAGIETTTAQRDRGVAAVDATDAALAERLAAFESALPCTAAAAAGVVEAFVAGASVGDAARGADVAPVTAAKALFRLGFDGVSPLSPTGREVVRDWLRADLTRTEALTLTGASDAEFALAAYVETHEAIPGAREAVQEATGPDGDAMVRKRDHLGETMSDVGELL
ncbi:MAG: hypothetical protein ABEJ70_06565 [Halobacteriaceae archaeon]